MVINSEVWDLRTLRLLRSCPALDGAAVTFAGADVLFAIQRPISDDLRETPDLMQTVMPMRTLT